MENVQQLLEQSRSLEQAFQSEVEMAQNAEVKSFFQKLASEQRTITNQLQNKANTANTANTADAQQNQTHNQAHNQQMNNQQAKNQQANNQQAKNQKADDTNA
jgi:hypothetical protein